jgi:hypothetical protein
MATIPPHCKRFEAPLVESAAEIAGHRGLYANRLTGPILAVEPQTRHCPKSWLQTLAANPGRKSWPQVLAKRLDADDESSRSRLPVISRHNFLELGEP